MHKRLIVNSATNFATFVISLAITFVLAPLMVRTLGDRNYGIWDTMLSICGYMGVLDLGVGPAIVTLVAKASAGGDARRVRKIFNSALIGLTLAGLLSFAALILASRFTSSILKIPPQETGDLPLLFIIFGINLLLFFPGTAFTAYLLGLQRHYYLNTLRTLLSVAQAFVTYAILIRPSQYHLTQLAMVQVGSYALLIGSVVVLILFKERSVAISPREADRSTLKQLYGFGLNSTMIMAAARIREQSMPLVITQTIGLAMVPYFSIPARLLGYAWGFAQAISFPITPVYGALDAQGKARQKADTWIDLSRWIQIIQLYMAVHVFFLGKAFIGLWMGNRYAEGGKWVLYFLSVHLMVDAISPNSIKYLLGVGRHQRPARMLLLFSILCVIASVLLLPGRNVGVLAAVLLATGSLTTCYLLRVVCADLGISPAHHLRSTFLPLAVPVAATGLLLFALQRLLMSDSYLLLVVHGCLGTLCYGILVWFFVLKPNERLAIVRRCCDFLALIWRGRKELQS
jgi:O-antigen/teichoic acid export membrane protein